MSNKTIKIQEILIDRSLLEWAPFCLVTGLHEHSGYYVVAANGQVFVEKSWWDNKDETETLALVNDTDLNREAKREATISFDVDKVEEKDIPVFGITIDDNYSIQQFNLSAEAIADDVALNSLFNSTQKPVYWDIDKNLHVGQNQYSEKQFKKYIDAVKTQGYANPVVLYVDSSFVRTYYYDLIPYLYYFLGCKTLPIRVITYKDFKYVKTISPAIYDAIKSVPANPYYAPEDKEDVSSFMVSNFSDKRDIIKSFMKNDVLDMNQKIILMDIDKLDEILPYLFTGNMTSKNKEFIEKLFAHKYPTANAFEEDHFMDSMSINESLYHYMNGYAAIKESVGTENVDFTSCKIIEEKDFDPSLYPFDSFDYLDYADADIQKIVKIVSDKFGPLCVHKDCPTQIIDVHNIHEAIKDKNTKVKVLGEK